MAAWSRARTVMTPARHHQQAPLTSSTTPKPDEPSVPTHQRHLPTVGAVSLHGCTGPQVAIGGLDLIGGSVVAIDNALVQRAENEEMGLVVGCGGDMGPDGPHIAPPPPTTALPRHRRPPRPTPARRARVHDHPETVDRRAQHRPAHAPPTPRPRPRTPPAPLRPEAVIHLAVIDLMARRLAGEATPNRRGVQSGTTRESPDQTLSEPSSHPSRRWGRGRRRRASCRFPRPACLPDPHPGAVRTVIVVADRAPW